jgi:hypothetical protein
MRRDLHLLDRRRRRRARFSIDSSTGALSFSAAPDFEAPADADADNVYDVQVQGLRRLADATRRSR